MALMLMYDASKASVRVKGVKPFVIKESGLRNVVSPLRQSLTSGLLGGQKNQFWPLKKIGKQDLAPLYESILDQRKNSLPLMKS